MAAAAPAFIPIAQKGDTQQTREKERSVRISNLQAGKAVADAVRTSLGPRGMDKMIISTTNDVTITNDGATILKMMDIQHPAGKMLVELSKAQDIEAGDGTTSVVVMAGSLLTQVQSLLQRGIHASIISESFQLANKKSQELLQEIAIPVSLADRESLIKAANTALSSKMVNQYTSLLSPVAVDAVLRVIDPLTAVNVDLKDIRVVSRLGGTVDDTELIDGLVLFDRPNEASAKRATGPKSVKNAKVGLIQFCLSAPKTNMESSVVVGDYRQMDRILQQESAYVLDMCKKIQATGCNVLLVQKSIIRDAVNDLSLHFLARMKILVVTNIEREDIEFISKTVHCLPVASVDQFSADKLGKADLVEEMEAADRKMVKITGVPAGSKTVCVLVRGSNRLMLDEAERSIHDALCVVRSLVKKRFLLAGGGAPETEITMRINAYADTLLGKQSFCVRAFADAFEVIPITLAENAGLNPINVLTELRARHQKGEKYAGVAAKKGVADMQEENVIQPLLVTSSAVQLATECVRMILKIDDIVLVR
jgi:T-complex protein 1 subunit delta